MIRPVHSITSRVLVGIGAALAALMAIGYAFIFSGIASPIARDLGTVSVVDDDGAAPVYLSDGRPAFVVRSGDRVSVVDARVPLDGGVPGRLVAWCDAGFVDLVGASSYTADGGLIAGDVPSGLIRYPFAASNDGGTAAVDPDGMPAEPATAYEPVPSCRPADALVHEPLAEEVFDPSVAIEEEPPGWVWMDGSLVAVGGQALLCDRAADCATGAVARGIDPANVGLNGLDFEGLFLGRIRDGAIEELHYVPQPEDVP